MICVWVVPAPTWRRNTLSMPRSAAATLSASSRSPTAMSMPSGRSSARDASRTSARTSWPSSCSCAKKGRPMLAVAPVMRYIVDPFEIVWLPGKIAVAVATSARRQSKRSKRSSRDLTSAAASSPHSRSSTPKDQPPNNGSQGASAWTARQWSDSSMPSKRRDSSAVAEIQMIVAPTCLRQPRPAAIPSGTLSRQ